MLLLYIDPGTGMLILQLILSFFAGVVIFFKSFRKKIKSFFTKKEKETK